MGDGSRDEPVHEPALPNGLRVDNGRATGVELESGVEIDADIVVSNADSAATYRHLVPASARRRRE